ncbi:MAG: regulatory protein TetR [Rhodospirillales bacterium]|nr:regulatory protein TetR [Rhodospirillales bacterium]
MARSSKPKNDNGNTMSATSIAQRSVERTLASRHAAYTDEVNRLMAASLAVMQRTGDFDPKVGEILAEAGLSNQAFYRHFQSKEELLLALLDSGIRQLEFYLAKRMAAQPDPVGKVRAWIRGFAAQAIRPTAAAATRPFLIPSARLQERFPAEIRAAEQHFLGPLTAVLGEACTAELVRPDLDPIADSVFVYDLVKGWLQRQLQETDLPPEAEIALSAGRLEHFIIRAIGADS